MNRTETIQWARAVKEAFPEEVPQEIVLKSGPRFVCWTNASTLPWKLWSSQKDREAR